MIYLRPRSISVAGRRTTVRLEEAYWDELRRMAAEKRMSIAQIVTAIDATRPRNLSSAIRVFILRDVRASLERTRIREENLKTPTLLTRT